jgi:predicted MFS family arabinose efflux permease
MYSAILFAIADRRIRAIAIALVLLGFTYASTFPYQSLIATQQLGMSEAHFGLMIFLIGFAGMLGNLGLGYFSDLAKNRKTAVLLCLAAGVVGFGGFALMPSMATFIFCMVFITPFSNSAYALLFGTVRGITNELGAREAGSVNAAIRSFYAISWIVVPGLVGLFIATRANPSDCYGVAALAFVLCLLFYWRQGPDVPGNTGGDKSAAANLREAVGLIFHTGRLSRLLALALINSAHPLIGYALPPSF